MQAVLLLAGKNSRFFPLETMGHKAMNRLYGKPIIEYLIEDFVKIGIQDFIFVLGKYDTDVKDYFNDGSAHGVKIQYSKQEEATGQGDALLTAKDMIEDSFIIPNPYHIFQTDLIKSIIEKFNDSNADGVIPGVYEENIHNYGSMVLEGNRIVGIVEKPAQGTEPSKYRVTSAYIFKKEFLDYLEKEPKQEYSYEAAITNYAKDKNIQMFEIDKEVVMPSLKYPWHLFDIKKIIDNNIKPFISEKATVAKNAVIEGNVYIDDGAKIFEGAVIKGNTYIGKNVIVGNNAMIRDCDLEDDVQVGFSSEITRSILMKGAHSHGVGFIGDSIIGQDCRIAASFTTANRRFDRAVVETLVKGEKTKTGLTSLGVIMGKEVKVGIQAVSMPGVLVAEKTIVWPNATIDKNITETSELRTNYSQELTKITNE